MLLTAIAGASLGGCASPPPPPSLPRIADGRLRVLGPDPGFDPRNPPAGWSLSASGEGSIGLSDGSGRIALSLRAPGGSLLIRTIDTPLGSWPELSWSWRLEDAAFGGGPGDGLRRGLRLIVGFDAGEPEGRILPSLWTRTETGLPAHRRRIEFAFGGTGAVRPELAMAEVSASADGGQKRILRPAAPGMTGRWMAERVDLRALYRDAFVSDRDLQPRIVFLALGALPARLPESQPPVIGHIVEVQLSP